MNVWPWAGSRKTRHEGSYFHEGPESIGQTERERESYHELSIPYHRFSHWPTKHFLAWPAFILYKAIYHSVAVHTHPCVKCAIHRSDRTGEILLWQRVFSWEKGGEGGWNDVPNIGDNDTQTKHIQTSSLVEHVIPTAPQFQTNFTKVDWSDFSWKKTLLPTFGINHFFSKQNTKTAQMFHEFGKPVVVTLWHSHMQVQEWQILRKWFNVWGREASPSPYIDGWLVGQNLQNIHTIHTPSMRRTCKSSASLQSTPLLCTRIWTMVSFPTGRNVDQVLCQSRSEMKSSSRLFFKSSYHSLIWNLSKKSLIFSQESLSTATE